MTIYIEPQIFGCFLDAQILACTLNGEALENSMTPTSSDSANVSVLLISEDRLIGADLAVTLQEIGYGVIVSSVKAALAPGFSSSPDLVVIDVGAVERGDALKAGARIGRRLARPVVYLVDDDDQAARVAEQSPESNFVMWPFPPQALESALRQAHSAHAGARA